MLRFDELCLFSLIHQQVVDELSNTNRPQLVDELISMPWGHHRYIIDKCIGNLKKALFFVRKTLENQWARGVLLNSSFFG